MLVVLNISYSLIQITIWTDTRCCKAVLNLAQVLFQYRDAIFTNNDSFHLHWLGLVVPFMGSNILNTESFCRVSVQYFTNKIF
jgi:hypothetical protein